MEDREEEKLRFVLKFSFQNCIPLGRMAQYDTSGKMIVILQRQSVELCQKVDTMAQMKRFNIEWVPD